MNWNPFKGEGRQARERRQEQESEKAYQKYCAEKAKEAGFDLDFAFEPKPEQEALIAELQKIAQNTFWADNPMDGKLDPAQMAPDDRAKYEAAIARKREIRVGHKDELLAYLAPYLPAAKLWNAHSFDQRVLDRALGHWTQAYGMKHRDRFFAAVSLSR
jgi:hypothetical protein